LKEVCRQIKSASFLALDEIVIGGAVGKGLLSAGTTAEIVLFVRQLPYRNFPQWLPHILDTLMPVLEGQLATAGIKAERFKVDKDHLRFNLVGGGAKGAAAADGSDLLVKVFISSMFKGPEHLLESIKVASLADRPYFSPAFVKERNDLIGRQTSRVKQLIRLTTWWASKQNWSSSLGAPSEWLLELIAVHACRQLSEAKIGGGTQDGSMEGMADAVAHIMDILADVEKLKVSWADSGDATYKPEDLWRPLQAHEPLFMDPFNPYSNLADASQWDPREVAAAALAPGCFLAFRREAAKWLLKSAEGGEVAEDEESEGSEESEESEEGAEEDAREVDDDEEDDEEYEDAEEGPG